jgi:hypothetical protein
MAAIIVTIIRFLVPFTILRWPLAGGLLAMLADTVDVFLFQAFGYGFWADPSYHLYDKIFDIWYLAFEFWAVRNWTDGLARKTAKGLFGWRLAGVALFELTGWRGFFFLAPNIFEYFFLWYLIARKIWPGFVLTKKKLIIALAVIGLPSFAKEYVMHFMEFQTWAFFRDHLFWWMFK